MSDRATNHSSNSDHDLRGCADAPSGAARADYDITHWGMTVAEVRKLYPGGVVQRLQTGEDEYSVIRKVNGLTTVSLFSFEHVCIDTGCTPSLPYENWERRQNESNRGL